MQLRMQIIVDWRGRKITLSNRIKEFSEYGRYGMVANDLFKDRTSDKAIYSDRFASKTSISNKQHYLIFRAREPEH